MENRQGYNPRGHDRRETVRGYNRWGATDLREDRRDIIAETDLRVTVRDITAEDRPQGDRQGI